MAKRIDSNQREIVECMRTMGATVAITSDLGRGFPDLVVLYRNQIRLVEIKDGEKPPSKRELTPKEKQFHHEWNGHVCIVYSVEGVIELLKSMHTSSLQPTLCH